MRAKVALLSVCVFSVTLVAPAAPLAGEPKLGGSGLAATADVSEVTAQLREGAAKASASGAAADAATDTGSASAASRAERLPGPAATRAEPQAEAAGSASVTIINFSFSPRDVTIDVGDSVTWTNRDEEPHDATADDGSWGTPLLDKGESASVTFEEAGTFSYICSVHPPDGGYPNFTGTVTVRAGGGATGGGGGGGSGTTGGGGGAVSESDATAAADAAGTSSKLPATGTEEVPLALLGAALLAAGALLRLGSRRSRIP